MTQFSTLVSGTTLVCLGLIGLALLMYLAVKSVEFILKLFGILRMFYAFLAWKAAKAKEPATLRRAFNAEEALVHIIDITQRKFNEQRMKLPTGFRLQAIRDVAQDALGKDIS